MKIKSATDAKRAIDELKKDGKSIVFTNGCFDIIHAGHVTYLRQAKSLGDILVVGLNSDASVQALKGPSRPLNTQEDRALVLAALEMIDLIVVFDETLPNTLIELLKPNIHVKGGDYTAEKLPEYPLIKGYGGSVIILPFVDGASTSGIISKILDNHNHPPQA